MKILDFLNSKADSIYLVTESALESKIKIDEIKKKIEKSKSLAVEFSSECENAKLLLESLNYNLVKIKQLKSPFISTFKKFDLFEILCDHKNLNWLINWLNQEESKAHFDRIFITFLDFPIQKITFLPVLITKNLSFFFEFSHYSSNLPSSMSVSEIRQFIELCKKNKINVLPPPGRPIWDHSIPPILELEPVIPITFQIGNSNSVIFSAIIPTYNSKHYLLNVLRHFSRQNMDGNKFEVIVIDDGSTDGSQEYIKGYFSRNQELVNLKYIYWPRPVARSRGDSYFRAGLSRNLGTYHAVGEFISFVDSDMLVPPNFLATLLNDLKNYDVVQNVRFHIKPELSNEYVRHEQIKIEQDTFIEEEKYWGAFFATDDWENLEAFWKYTCTYNLSLRKDVFYEVGRFRRNFVSYGFEDTDLGFRLAKAGKKFFLSKNYSLHLTPEKSQSEYRNSQIHRHILLSKTAKKFFLNNLDPFIYDHLNVYMGGEYPKVRKLITKIKSSLFNSKNNF